ncbi:MAG: hypothetical protein F6J97_12035 [Leptolyngbya sp. SIO4C1]|nr:hypothetical protein [Leptolyngbya sp. SIO4C1]
MQFDSIINLLQKGLLLFVSFADDLLLVFLSRLGLSWPWLQWLSTLLLLATLVYWSIRLLLYLRRLRASTPEIH